MNVCIYIDVLDGVEIMAWEAKADGIPVYEGYIYIYIYIYIYMDVCIIHT
jgi:hypothetical protein